MAHFADLDENNIVRRVIVIGNADILDENGIEQESIGIELCKKIAGGDNWVQTSYNNNFRKQYAGIGDKYLPEQDIFYNPVKPYDSWTLDENYDWQPPTPMPLDGTHYYWDEETLSWEVVRVA